MGLDAARGLLACPVCAGPLSTESPAACPAGHSFDVARQGHLNLLGGPPPANADTTDMVAARERFLATGAYDRIAADVARRVAGSRATTLLEVGAGTGFYSARALDVVPSARGVALDVSPLAARRAARAHDRLASVVADVWRPMPVRSGRIGVVLAIFAPRNIAEFARVLTPGGLFVAVTPTPRHLADLRSAYGLLGIEEDKDVRLQRSVLGHLESVAANRIEYAFHASAEQVRDLIAMGPNAFHGAPTDVQPATVQVSVTVSLFRKPQG